MHKFEKSKANNSSSPNKTPRVSFSEDLDNFEFDDKSYISFGMLKSMIFRNIRSLQYFYVPLLKFSLNN